MPHIIPIKELKNTSEISEVCHSAQEPIFITKNGYGDMVLMSMAVYEQLMKKLELYQQLAISEQQIVEGKVDDAQEHLAQIKERYSRKL